MNSNDPRGRVVATVESGESCRAVAARFGVAVSSVVKWHQRYRRTGSVAPGKMGATDVRFSSRTGTSSSNGSDRCRT